MHLGSKSQLISASQMEPESDDEPQGSTAVPSGVTCHMCGDVFDDFELGTFPFGRLHLVRPLPQDAVHEETA